MPLPKDSREFVESLNSNGVEFLVVGAHCLAFHGVPRYTGDLDLLVRSSPQNAARLMKSLTEFGFGALNLAAADFEAPDQVIQLGIIPNRIDLLTSISGVTFEEAWATKAPGELSGVGVYFLSREALIRNKRAAGRPRDRADIEELGEAV